MPAGSSSEGSGSSSDEEWGKEGSGSAAALADASNGRGTARALAARAAERDGALPDRRAELAARKAPPTPCHAPRRPFHSAPLYFMEVSRNCARILREVSLTV